MDNQKKKDGLCNGLSITSLVLSILGFLTGWLAFGLMLFLEHGPEIYQHFKPRAPTELP